MGGFGSDEEINRENILQGESNGRGQRDPASVPAAPTSLSELNIDILDEMGGNLNIGPINMQCGPSEGRPIPAGGAIIPDARVLTISVPDEVESNITEPAFWDSVLSDIQPINGITQDQIDASSFEYRFQPGPTTSAREAENKPEPGGDKSEKSVSLDKLDRINSCHICLEKFMFEDDLRRLACLHVFHKECIDKWLKRNMRCPICRISAPINNCKVLGQLLSGVSIEAILFEHKLDARAILAMNREAQLIKLRNTALEAIIHDTMDSVNWTESPYDQMMESFHTMYESMLEDSEFDNYEQLDEWDEENQLYRRP